MILPNFLIIGAQKSGTTWLMEMLSQHPEVYLPPYEVHYFSNEKNYRKGTEWYASHFENAESTPCIGEKTPNYFSTVNDDPIRLPENIHMLLPQAKLIVILREPVSRAISGINHDMSMGGIKPNSDIDQLIPEYISTNQRNIWFGYYYRHLQAYLKLYDREQMLILIFERDVKSRPQETLHQVCNFLEIDPTFDFQYVEKAVNVFRASKPELYLIELLPHPLNIMYRHRVMHHVHRVVNIQPHRLIPSKASKELLRQTYAEENERLFEFLGTRITEWE